MVSLAACRKPQPGASAMRESADRGKRQIIAYGCGSCHVIPGIRQATGLVGPPLTHFAKRAYIAGEVPNTPEFLTQWIAVPQSIEPGTVMPNLGVSYGKARDIAAYLYTLK
jgi:cytochrome c